jgi:ABC-type phosphate transport system substrate-binding protein
MGVWKFISILALSFLAMLPARPAQAADDVVFIVNSQNPETKLTINELRDYYFKHRRTWPDGTSVRFIDSDDLSSTRKIFLSRYLEKSAKDINLYWIGQKLYSGDSPPLQEGSESMIVEFVGSLKGAIGYVSNPSVVTSKDVKIVKVENPGK